MRNLRFWQRAYLLTILLFLLALFGGFTLVGWVNQQQTLAAEVEKDKQEQQLIAQNLSRDFSAAASNEYLSLPTIVRFYGQSYAQSGLFIEVGKGGDTLFSNMPSLPEGLLGPSASEGELTWAVHQIDEASYIVVASRLSRDFADYTLVTAHPMDTLMQSWGQMQQLLTGGSIAVSVVLAIALFFILRSLSKPLERLAGVADDFAGGDFSARAAGRGGDEIGNLAKSFNAMADTAESNITEIRKVADQNARMSANLSHEIRTPLTAIQGYAEYLQLADLKPEEQETALAYIIAESKRLKLMSERMLQLSTLDHDEIDMEPVALEDVIGQVAQSLGGRIAEAGVDFRVEPLPDVEVRGDDVLLESLFTNLVDNAIKACGDKGAVTVRAIEGKGTVRIEVADNGRGLSPDELERLGEPFYRPDKARSRQKGGSGLGIALCFQIAELHHAKLDYESQKGKGTKVSVEFTTL